MHKGDKKIKEKSRSRLEMAGKIYRSDGVDAYDALLNLPIDYTHIKTKGTVTLSVKGKTAERFLYMRTLRMIFANKTRKIGLAKQLESLLK